MITGASVIQEAERADIVQPEEQKAQGDFTVCLQVHAVCESLLLRNRDSILSVVLSKENQ